METTSNLANEGVPQSQRMTLPTPPPVAVLADAVKAVSPMKPLKPSVGSYLIINEGARARRAVSR